METCSHMFLECPVVAPAVEWLRGLWASISGGPPPPLDARVLLLGMRSVWAPPRGRLSGLWHFLRLAYLKSVWVLREQRRMGGGHFTAQAVVAVTAATVEKAIRQDWVRVFVDVRALGGSKRGLSAGPQELMDEEQFESLWCQRSVLARVQGGSLVVHVPRVLPGATGA